MIIGHVGIFQPLDFTNAGKLMIGLYRGQKFDFKWATFLGSAGIELHNRAELNIRLEQLKYISLYYWSRYLWKNDIIDNLKSKSFRNDKCAQFEKELNLNFWETLLSSAYSSVMVFFTFRLKRDILTFFDAKGKRLIVVEWFIGFLVYVTFLTLSKSGSILHNLKELFAG